MPKINWDSFYNDLPVHVASALREARVKPDQLATKSEGELLTIPGIKDTDISTIQAIYSVENKAELEAETAKVEEVAQDAAEVASTPRKPKKARSQKYNKLKKSFDQTKLYTLPEALTILNRLSAGSKLKTLELHLNVRETGIRGELKLPHSTGKETRIAIFGDALITDLNAGTIEFDILLATPADMPKLAKYAKLLGPRGLMPNPKNGTIIEDPEARQAELAKGGTLPYKTESKFPIIHLSMGTISQSATDLLDNLTEAFRVIGIAKIKSAYLTCTHTPSVKISLTELK
jgi:large subunit ribosomal protein L1